MIGRERKLKSDQSPGDDVSEQHGLWTDIKGLSRVWPYLRLYPKSFATAAILVPFIALTEMSVPFAIKYAIDEGVVGQNFKALTLWSAVYLAAVVGQYFFRSLQSITASFAVYGLIRDLRDKTVAHILRLSSSFHDKQMSGRLVTRATSDFDNLSDSLNSGVLTSVVDLAMLFGSMVGLALLDLRLAWVVFGVIPVIVLTVRYFASGMKKNMVITRAKIAKLNGFAQECLYASSTVKVLSAEQDVSKKFESYSEEFRKAQMKAVGLDAAMYSVVDGMSSITMGLILYFAIQSGLNGNEAMTAGLMVAFVQYVQQMFEPVKNLSNKIAMLQGAFTAIDRVFELLSNQSFVDNSRAVPGLRIIEPSVEFRNVQFMYGSKREKGILAGVSLQLLPQRSLALVGRTGSGKSTLVKLLARLYDGYDGQIILSGRDLREYNDFELRQQIAIVPQDITLFTGTVLENISLSRPYVSDESCLQAARMVGVDRFIQKLTLKYEERVSEEGKNFSLGERQLIVFARALAANPKLIILDEATSSMDYESEKLVQSAIHKMIASTTVIVIAHRLSTIQNCDQIAVMEAGRIVEVGTHLELLERRSSYFNLSQPALAEAL